MRTTLILVPDATGLLRRIRNARGGSSEAVANDALRQGLGQMVTLSDPPARYRTPTVDLGRCLAGSLDDVAKTIAVAEEEELGFA